MAKRLINIFIRRSRDAVVPPLARARGAQNALYRLTLDRTCNAQQHMTIRLYWRTRSHDNQALLRNPENQEIALSRPLRTRKEYVSLQNTYSLRVRRGRESTVAQ